jgi:glucosamine 6-phosphate synthetase-like amidotransferase/phosphosugar isomerase protein
VAIDKENPEQMVVCRKGSPIQIGFNEDSIFVASEVNYFI